MISSKQLLKFGRFARPVSILGEIIIPRKITRYNDEGNSEDILIIDLFGQILYHNLDSEQSNDIVLQCNISTLNGNSQTASNLQNLTIKCQIISTMPITLKIVEIKI